MGSTYRHEDGRFGSIVSPSLVPFSAEYGECWQHVDVRAEHVFHAIACGQCDVQADHLFFTEAEAAELPIFRDFLHPRGFGWAMSVPVSPLPAVQVILTLLRAREQPGYDAEAQGRLLALKLFMLRQR